MGNHSSKSLKLENDKALKHRSRPNSFRKVVHPIDEIEYENQEKLIECSKPTNKIHANSRLDVELQKEVSSICSTDKTPSNHKDVDSFSIDDDLLNNTSNDVDSHIQSDQQNNFVQPCIWNLNMNCANEITHDSTKKKGKNPIEYKTTISSRKISDSSFDTCLSTSNFNIFSASTTSTKSSQPEDKVLKESLPRKIIQTRRALNEHSETKCSQSDENLANNLQIKKNKIDHSNTLTKKTSAQKIINKRLCSKKNNRLGEQSTKIKEIVTESISKEQKLHKRKRRRFNHKSQERYERALQGQIDPPSDYENLGK